MERRRYARLQTRKGAAAVLGNSRKGLITDINREGLSFQFLGSANANKNQKQLSSSISIIYDDFVLADLCCSIVTDQHLLKKYATYLSLNLFKCCVHFKNVPSNKRSHLEYFIQSYTHKDKYGRTAFPIFETFEKKQSSHYLSPTEKQCKLINREEELLAVV